MISQAHDEIAALPLQQYQYLHTTESASPIRNHYILEMIPSELVYAIDP